MAPVTTTTQPADADRALLAALRTGDEAAFRTLVGRHQPAMLAVALRYVHDRVTAEEVVQDTWLAVLRQLDRFEARSTVKTWIFSILVNRARSRWKQQARTIPGLGESDQRPAVPATRFLPDDAQWPGHWAQPPTPWHLPPAMAEVHELRAVVREAIAVLPAGQRSVIALRDIEGWTSQEVCTLLGISSANQRVLLHRARSRVREALERYLSGSGG